MPLVESQLHLSSLDFSRARCQLLSRHLSQRASVFHSFLLLTFQHYITIFQSLKLDAYINFCSFFLAMNLMLEHSSYFRTLLLLHSHVITSWMNFSTFSFPHFHFSNILLPSHPFKCSDSSPAEKIFIGFPCYRINIIPKN